MSKPVHQEMNLAEIQAANNHNAQMQTLAVKGELAAQEQITKLSGDNINGAPSGTAPSKTQGSSSSSPDSGSSKALSTEGGLYSDIALEACGGSAAKLAKNLYDVVANSDPGSFQGMNTMENFASPGKRAIFTGEKSFLGNLFGSVQIAGDSINGETKVKGAKATKQSAMIALATTCDLQKGLGMVNEKQLGAGQQLANNIGGLTHRGQQQGMGLGGNNSVANLNRGLYAQKLALDEMRPKGPTDTMLTEESGAA